jgi:thiol-disulfide isomerase/thioredoxin
MKIVIVILGLLVLSAGIYLYALPSVTSKTAVSINSIEIPEIPLGEQCTGTSCEPTSGRATETETGVGVRGHTKTSTAVGNADNIYSQYIDFINPSGYVNSDPFTLADYVGKKIILVEFITYSCINCQRTFPYLQQWHERYEKDGLLVVGIHTPEFSYEGDRNNVVAAMKKQGITFPIVMDNEYETWNAYKNRFWPHRYVIDYEGNVVYDHIGEGAYAETEAVIKKLLNSNTTGV